MKVKRDGKDVEILCFSELTDQEQEQYLAKVQENIEKIEDPEAKATAKRIFDLMLEENLDMIFPTDEDREAEKEAEFKAILESDEGPQTLN